MEAELLITSEPHPYWSQLTTKSGSILFYWSNSRHGSNGVFCDILPFKLMLSRALDTVDWFTFIPLLEN